MTPTVNIILPTIRFLPVTQDIIRHVIGAAEETTDIHVTIADGQEDDQKKEWIVRQAGNLAGKGQFTYIGLKDATERLLRAAQLDTEWILPLSDDDPYSVNLIRAIHAASRTVSSDTMAILPYAFLSYSCTRLSLMRVQDIEDEEQGARLLSLYKQAPLNGYLTWSMIRRKPFLEWMKFLRTKPIWPTYADQVLASYLVMKGKIVASKEECFYGKDEQEWHDLRRAIIKDSGSYPNKFFTLFHEISLISDLFTFLHDHGLKDEAVPSLTVRAAALLTAGASYYEHRLRVLGIDKSRESEEANSLVINLATYANALSNAPVDEHVRFFMQVQAVGRTLGMSPTATRKPDVHDTKEDSGWTSAMSAGQIVTGQEIASRSNVRQIPPLRHEDSEGASQSAQSGESLRLLMVVHGFPPKQIGGTELYAYTLAKEFQRRGHSVRVLCPEYGQDQAEGTIAHGVYDGLDVARIQVRHGDFISQFNNERLLPALRRYVAGLAVDLIHIHHLIGISASAPKVFAEYGIPMVMTMHDEWLLCPQCHFLRPDGTFCKDGPETVDKCVHCLVRRSGQSVQSDRLPELFYALALRRQVLRKTAGLIDTFVVPSQFIGEELTRHGGDHPRIVLSPLGLSPFHPLSWRPRTDRLRFTFLGSICFTKGLDLAIRAFNLTDPNTARLDLYGQVLDPVYFGQAMSYVKPGYQVKYHGPYSPTDLPSILAETDVTLIPSRSENYPCVVRESLHAGVPVIAPNVGGVPEIIRDGENGLLFETGDYEDLARKLCFFVGDPERVMTFRKRVRPMRTTNQDADQLEVVYRDALTRRSNAAETPITRTSTSLQEVQACLHLADDYAAKGDWAAAHNVLTEARQRVPNDPQLIVAYGNVLLRLDDVEAARREFVKATVLHPDCAPAHADLAAVLLHLGRGAEAEASARQALQLDAANISALKVLAKVCLDTERYQEAVQAYATILEHAPDDLETLILVGNCYAETGRFEQARSFYQKVLALDPGNVVAAENLAEVDRLASASNGTAREPIAPATSEGRPSASIVIVTYNSAATIRACLDSVLCESGPATELIVVDNVSTDTTRAILDTYRDRADVILNADNVGFSAACNQGIRASSGEYVVLLNPDTVVTSGWLDRLIAHIGPGVGAVGPVSDYVAALQKYQLYDPGPQSGLTGTEIAARMARANRGRAVETRLLIGFCLMVPRRVLDDVGLLDEELFLGNDDLDLSWRMRLRGYKLLVATDTFVHHEGQVSFKSEAETKTSRLVQESTDRLYTKLEAHYGPGNAPSPMELWGITWFKPTKTPLTPHPSPLISIIILTHNGLEHTKRCLVSIETHTPEPHELIVVDNGSTDGTLDYLRGYMATHDNVRVVANRTNRGFAAGNNQGLALARGEYVLLLNNDTIVTEAWLRRMLQIFEAYHDVGIVGPMSNYVSGPQLVRDVSYKGPEGLEAFAVEWAHVHDGQSSAATRVVGFCLLARKEVIARIGGLDEQFGSGNFEDDDFCIRAFQVGFRARIALDVFIHHAGSQTFKSAKIDYRQSLMRNWDLFKRKWGIPADASYEKGYHFPPQPAPASPLSIPLPDVGADHRCEVEGRWWPEPRKELGESQNAATGEARFNAVIVPNGHGIAPLWPSLLQHTNHPLAITIVSSIGNGNGHGALQQPICPEGWQINTADVPAIRLLNRLLQSAGTDPVILLSGDLVLTPGWLKRLLGAIQCDQKPAAVGPTSNHGAAAQWVKADYKGTGKALRQFALRRAHRYGKQLAVTDNLAPSSIVFNPAVCRAIGPLREDLDLTASLTDYFARITQAGHTLAVALDAYVHCSEKSGQPSAISTKADVQAEG